jgi:hypothetical protein
MQNQPCNSVNDNNDDKVMHSNMDFEFFGGLF